MGKTVRVARAKNETPAQLKGTLTQLVLLVAAFTCSFSRNRVIFTKKMEQVGGLQFRRAVGLAQFINQQRKPDSGFFTENACVVAIAQPNRRQCRAFLAKLLFVFAQLRDVFAAENSAVMAQENQHSRTAGPKRAELNFFSVAIGQRNPRERGTEGFLHDWFILRIASLECQWMP